MYDPGLDCFDEFTSRFIRAKTRQLIGRAGLTKSDYPDLIQQFALNLIQRRTQFDPGRGPWGAFVTVVCKQSMTTILDRQRAKMRSCSREACSLNRPVEGAAEMPGDLGDMIADGQQKLDNGQACRSHEEAVGLAQDIDHLLDCLPPSERDLCERLCHAACKSSVARDLGMSQGAFYDRLERIRKKFEQKGLRDYLK